MTPIRALLLAGLVAATPAMAQTPAIVLVCGGIGLEESLQMRHTQAAHALTVLFATEQGGYVAGVNTRVEAASSGAVAVNEQCGPVAQIDVESAGTYRIRAELDGVPRKAEIDLVPEGGRSLVLRWPE